MTNSGFPRNSAAPTGAPADPPGDEAAAEALDSIEGHSCIRQSA